MSADKLNRDAPEPPAEPPASSSASEPPAEPPAIGDDDAPALPPSAAVVGEGELPPATPSGAKIQKPRTKLTPAQKRARRNAYLRDKRARDKADAAARKALGLNAAPAAPSAPSTPAATVDSEARDAVNRIVGELRDAGTIVEDAPAPKVETIDTAQLETLIGLSFHGVSRMLIPPKYGGGDLTPEERELLGKAWALPLAPYLTGTASAFGMAAISTVQVFAMRALTYTPAEVPQRIESDETAAAPAPAAKPARKAHKEETPSDKFNL